MSNPAVSVPHPQNSLPAINLITESEFRLLISTIPSWEPGNNLAHFITSVERLIEHLKQRLSPTLSFVLNNTIRLKIQGEANNFLSCVNAETWDEIKSHLLQRYGDQRDEHVLAHILRTCVQFNSESHREFYVKIIEALHALIEHLQITVSDKNLVAFKTYDYNKLANQVFLSGIKEPYRTYLMHKNYATLEQNLNACYTYDNHREQNNYYDFLRNQNKTNNTKPFQKQMPQKNNFYPQFSNKTQQQPLQPQTFQNSFNKFKQLSQPQHTFTPKPFAGCINKTLPRHNQFPTSKEVFGNTPKPKSPWIPGKPTSNQFKPTPMSIQSRTPTNNYQQRQPFFNQNRKPDFMVEELFHNEVDLRETNHAEEPQYEYFEEQTNECYYPEFDDTYEESENFPVTASETQ